MHDVCMYVCMYVCKNCAFVLHVDFVYFIINISNNGQTRETHKFPQGKGVFHLVACCCNFRRESEREEGSQNEMKRKMKKTLKNCIVCYRL